ncbi:hypothetical protein MHU86_10111 [Fragilaria crotonensis]|nr:hypothetical protein MHU86_10111 [Fragilaria crotonensis]
MAENNNNNNNNMIENFVRDPHDHDVLLGRGGLSNHHPGNNWFRRLVRSNKALYDQAQKHTKLLVAKAIVHHVQAQDPPGRFLEKDKESGVWKEATYNKAVHKTSQALRERKLLENEVNLQVQQTLQSLAIPIAPLGDGITTQAAATVTPSPAPVTLEENNLTPSHLLCNKRLRQQSSGFLRFFSKAPQGSAAINNDTAMMHGGFDQSLEPTRFAPADANFLGTSQYVEPVSLNNPLFQNIFNHDGTSSHSIEPLPLNNNKKRSRDTFEPLPHTDAPALTRLTTQVSDWLQSFWPIGEDRSGPDEEVEAQQHQPMHAADPTRHQPQRPKERRPQKQLHHSHQTATVAPATTSQTSASPDLNVQLTVVAESVANLKQQIQTKQIGTSAAATIQQIQMQLEQMQAAIASSTTSSSSSTNVDEATTIAASTVGLASSPPPTTLQPSVTSALWTLASTPSRLFSGLSSMFGDSTSDGEVHHEGIRELGGSLDTIGGHDMHSGGLTSNGIMKNTLNGTTEDIGLDPLDSSVHQPPLEDNNSASLMPPPPLGMAQFGGNKNNNANPFTSIPKVADMEQDPRFGRKASGSLFDDGDD